MRKGCILNALLVTLFLVMLSGCTSNQEVTLLVKQQAAEVEQNESGNTPIEATVTQVGTEQKQITDMSEAFDTILNHVTKEFIAGYTVDESFLMWFDKKYGDFAIQSLKEEVLAGNSDVNLWYELTGESIHVLWLSYCQDTGFQQYLEENVFWKESQNPDQTTLSFVGDINLDEDWYTTKYMDEQPKGIYDCISEDLLSLMNASDVMMVNNEFAYCESGTPLKDKAYIFRADPKRVAVLDAFGTDLVNLANNHVYDYGEKGMLETLDTIKSTGIPYVGAGVNLDEAEKIVYFVINGRKIAIVSASEIERTKSFTKEATEETAGVLKMLNPDKFIHVIERAKETSDYVIAVTHWGTEGKVLYERTEMSYAEKLVAAGADAVIGGHPHRLQGGAFVGEAPVAYSLGNFWFSTGTLYTTVAQIVIDKDGTLRLQYVPCLQENLTTRLLTSPKEKEDFFDYLATISYDIGIDAEGFVYDKYADAYKSQNIQYDSEFCNADVSGLFDNDNNAIDIVGNLKDENNDKDGI